ncbi:Pi31 proteasome regulator [Scedosporium apiospermum]|uniref:Pi31 proteasome regulator n=1 Tax=Pseudallescheria apiosperma TaxID=563466 RepID=A0A084G262_PSEDA|nr:Pi31 proteasome regulator [Scedosporium apiospermum]KEZ41424.1 Pi31 proteasome regulator [Scedosporium apiospermum]
MAESLRKEAILQGMADAIPTHPQGDSSSDLSSSYEVLALLIHSYMTALKFRLLGFNEDKKIEDECTSLAPRLPPSWNDTFGSHSFVYAHKQSAMTFVVKVDRLGNKVEIRGLAVGDDKIYRFERNIRDIVRSAGLPVRIPLDEAGAEDRSGLRDKLRQLFVSDQAIDDVLNEFKVKIVQKFIPKLQVEGYEETPDLGAGPSEQPRPRPGELGPRPPLEEPRPPQPGHPYPFYDPLAAPPPRRPIPGDFPPPGFEDPHEINTRPRGTVPPGPGPFDIGHDDLYPAGLGPHDPIRPYFTGGEPGLPRPGGRPGGFGGMHPTFDDPLFQGPGGGQAGEDSFHDPQRPPGARWDPVGPGGGPRPRQGGGQHPFGGGPSGGGFGGDII